VDLSPKRESILVEVSSWDGRGAVNRTGAFRGSSDREAKLNGSSLLFGCAAGWGGVLDMLRCALHAGAICLMVCVWYNGVRAMEDGRSKSSPNDRELIFVELGMFYALDARGGPVGVAIATSIKFDDGCPAYRDFPKFVGSEPGAVRPKLCTSLLNFCLFPQHATLTYYTLLSSLYILVPRRCRDCGTTMYNYPGMFLRGCALTLANARRCSRL
jgi:hypothetical protein